MHVDINADVFDRNFRASVTIAADAAAALTALLERLPARQRDDALERTITSGHNGVREEQRQATAANRVSPAALFDSLRDLCGPDAVFAADSGNGTFLAMEHLCLEAPGRFLAPIDYSCMGYSVPAAIGAKLASPHRDVVALAGDGALLMTGLELLTASACAAGVVAVVLRDEELAQIAQFQRTALNRATCSRVAPYSVQAFATATNCEYAAAMSDADVRPALAKALGAARAGRPVMVEVAIDYSRKTYFTRGVVATTFWRLGWGERIRLLGRAIGRRLGGA